jgi:hypothetical protein
MAFQTSAGYGNLPNGNFSPVIYSKKAQLAFRNKSVIQSVSNTDYMGELSGYGDSVLIIKEPDITINAYARGGNVVPQDLVDDIITLNIDKANEFAFKVDDIEAKHTHVNWESLAANRAGYKLADAMDQECISHLEGQISTATPDHLIGTTSTPQDVQLTKTSGDFTPLELLNRFKRLLDEQNVPEDSRWCIIDPYFAELLGDEDSKLLSDDFTSKGIVRNGMVGQGIVRGFQLHMSNNLTSSGDGPSGTGYGYLLAGHKSCLATAEQISKTETLRAESSFADIVRGLHVYGRKVLRKEALVGAVYHTA